MHSSLRAPASATRPPAMTGSTSSITRRAPVLARSAATDDDHNNPAAVDATADAGAANSNNNNAQRRPPPSAALLLLRSSAAAALLLVASAAAGGRAAHAAGSRWSNSGQQHQQQATVAPVVSALAAVPPSGDGGDAANASSRRPSRQQQRQQEKRWQQQAQQEAQQRHVMQQQFQQQVQRQQQDEQQQQQQQQPTLPPGAAAAALLSRGVATDLGAAAFGSSAALLSTTPAAVDDAAASPASFDPSGNNNNSNSNNTSAAVAPPPTTPTTTTPAPTASPPPQLPPIDPALAALPAHERAVVALFEANTPSVVHVAHLPRATQASSFSALDERRLPLGQGTGIIWDRAGHVLTNHHVVKGASEVKVTLHDRTTHTARVVGCDPAKDVAVLRLAGLPKHRAEGLRPAVFGSSGLLRVGQSVFAIGNPFGLDHTLAQGVISGLGRELSTGLSSIKGIIQTDCAIHPGNSGGPLIDSSGRVIGVNIGIMDPSGKGAFGGVGFAIPIDTVQGLVRQILRHGRVLRPGLGVTIAPAAVLRSAGQGGGLAAEGALVLEVPAGSPAAAAGIRPTYRDVFGDIVLGDVIVALDARPVRCAADLAAALDEKRVGDRARVDLLRDGRRLSVTVTLGERGAAGMAEE